MRNRLIALALLLCVLLSGCAGQAAAKPEQKQYTATFLTLFDTITSIVGRAESQEAFQATAQAIHDELLEYHRLFDIYQDYDGVINLKTVNEKAAIAPVVVDQRILDLLKDCKTYCEATGGVVNPAMGSVLSLWHEARDDGINDPANAYLPAQQDLEEAGKHMDFSQEIQDGENYPVFLAAPALRLDVGAIAKGWSVQRVCQNAPSGLLVSVGGNVCATGPKDPSGTPWVVGIQDPNGGDSYLHTLNLTQGSVVTSGDYQRAYRVGGEIYHHIIDPETLYPGTRWRSVTILCADSGLADALSTALFLLPQEEGQQLLDRFGAEALWMDREGSRIYSPGFQANIRN